MMRTLSFVGCIALMAVILGVQANAQSPAGDPPSATPPPASASTDATEAQWSRRDEPAGWVAEETAKHQVKKPADNRDLIGKGQGSTYGQITPQDVALWELESYKMAVEGSTIFHSADRLKSEVAVSCDMCHPDGANTHPETYPKFQAQLGRVALLRDMVNWCIENPVRGVKLEPDSPEMRALEAYIYAQRQGTPLQYGKR